MRFEPGGGAGEDCRPVEGGGAFGAGVAEAFVFIGGFEELDDAFGDGGRGFGGGDNARLVGAIGARLRLPHRRLVGRGPRVR